MQLGGVGRRRSWLQLLLCAPRQQRDEGGVPERAGPCLSDSQGGVIQGALAARGTPGTCLASFPIFALGYFVLNPSHHRGDGLLLPREDKGEPEAMQPPWPVAPWTPPQQQRTGCAVGSAPRLPLDRFSASPGLPSAEGAPRSDPGVLRGLQTTVTPAPIQEGITNTEGHSWGHPEDLCCAPPLSAHRGDVRGPGGGSPGPQPCCRPGAELGLVLATRDRAEALVLACCTSSCPLPLNLAPSRLKMARPIVWLLGPCGPEPPLLQSSLAWEGRRPSQLGRCQAGLGYSPSSLPTLTCGGQGSRDVRVCLWVHLPATPHSPGAEPNGMETEGWAGWKPAAGGEPGWEDLVT